MNGRELKKLSYEQCAASEFETWDSSSYFYKGTLSALTFVLGGDLIAVVANTQIDPTTDIEFFSQFGPVL